MVATARRRLARLRLWLWLTVIGLLIYSLYAPLSAALRPAPDVTEIFPHGEIRVGLDPSRPPFASVNAEGEYIGLEVDLGRALAEQIGLPVRFVGLGFDGLYDALQTDQVDVVIAGLQPTLATDGNTARFTRHYFDAGLVLLSPAGYESMRDLPGRALAYEFGSPADAEAHQWLRRVRPFELRPYELPQHALDAVRLNDAHAALVSATDARLYLRDHPDFTADTEHITHAWYTVATRNDRAHVLAVMNATLQHLDDTGRLDAILDKWL